MAMPHKITFTIVDGKSFISRTSVYVDPLATYEQVKEVAENFLPVIKSMTEGAVTGCTITQSFIPEFSSFDLPDGAEIHSDIEDGCYWRMKNITSGAFCMSFIPTFDEKLYVNGRIELPVGGAVGDYVNWYIFGVPTDTGTVALTNYRGEDLNHVISGVQQFRPR